MHKQQTATFSSCFHLFYFIANPRAPYKIQPRVSFMSMHCW